MHSVQCRNLHKHTPCIHGKWKYFCHYQYGGKNILDQIEQQENCAICGQAIMPTRHLLTYFYAAYFCYAPIVCIPIGVMKYILNMHAASRIVLWIWLFFNKWILFTVVPALICTFGQWRLANVPAYEGSRRWLTVRFVCLFVLSGLITALCVLAIRS